MRNKASSKSHSKSQQALAALHLPNLLPTPYPSLSFTTLFAFEMFGNPWHSYFNIHLHSLVEDVLIRAADLLREDN